MLRAFAWVLERGVGFANQLKDLFSGRPDRWDIVVGPDRGVRMKELREDFEGTGDLSRCSGSRHI